MIFLTGDRKKPLKEGNAGHVPLKKQSLFYFAAVQCCWAQTGDPKFNSLDDGCHGTIRVRVIEQWLWTSYLLNASWLTERSAFGHAGLTRYNSCRRALSESLGIVATRWCCCDAFTCYGHGFRTVKADSGSKLPSQRWKCRTIFGTTISVREACLGKLVWSNDFEATCINWPQFWRNLYVIALCFLTRSDV